MELYDEQRTPISYLGIEKQQQRVLVLAQDIRALRDTAKTVVRELVQPLEQAVTPALYRRGMP